MSCKTEDTRLKNMLFRLTGIETDHCPQPAPIKYDSVQSIGEIGYSQINEILLTYGFGRISKSFFQFLLNGDTEYRHGSAFCSIETLEQSVSDFRHFATLLYGNIRSAFDDLSTASGDYITSKSEQVVPYPIDEFCKRHKPINPIKPIPSENTYYLGYMIEREINDALEKDSNDINAQKSKETRDKIVDIGIHNHNAYLNSDHMDVYVATSMRKRHEYLIVNSVCKKVFEGRTLSPMNLRYFDPTQAYCQNRIDKGLSEALMLKRAKCTLYLLQETDTLGKDSELASTLAQGKPVIAFIPKIEEKEELDKAKQMVELLKETNPEKSKQELIIEHLSTLNEQLAWTDSQVQQWCSDPESGDLDSMIAFLGKTMRIAYEKRANTLKEDHPLGIQVKLDEGIANGVLVARTEEQCAILIKQILLNSLQLELHEPTTGKYKDFLLLKEPMTESVFRVVSNDPVLTNSFWTFYK